MKFNYKFIYVAYHQNDDLTVEVHDAGADLNKVRNVAKNKANELQRPIQINQTSITLDKDTGKFIKFTSNVLSIECKPELQNESYTRI